MSHKSFFRYLSVLVVLGSFIPRGLLGESESSVARPMDRIFVAYKVLQPLMLDIAKFNDPANFVSLEAALRTLRENFSKLENHRGAVAGQAGFEAQLQLVTDMLDDTWNRLQEGKRDYAFLRLRALTERCVSCHSTFNATVQFSDPSSLEGVKGDYERAEFFMASRQFAKAEALFLKVAENPREGPRRMAALRKWLTVRLRNSSDFKQTTEILTKFVVPDRLAAKDQADVRTWLRSLTLLASRKSQVSLVAEAKALMRGAIPELFGDASQADDVALLRATTLLHRALEQPETHGNARAEVLYLLGLGYSELPAYFIDELPEIYLYLCITEFPGTNTSQRAFELYRRIVAPAPGLEDGAESADIRLRLEDLYRKAYEIPALNGRI